ncbi:MAG: hypothetical protein A4E63_00691 [Syntrophorhabdus sp. PtaU1.Bin050]|nr:MAG: hypothetical protein A4E63_00691 [Syntrophorhabdus sp. PtaU1.Bin050]
MFSVDPAAGKDLHPFSGYAVNVYLVAYIDCQRIRDINTLIDQLNDFVIASKLNIHPLLHENIVFQYYPVFALSLAIIREKQQWWRIFSAVP